MRLTAYAVLFACCVESAAAAGDGSVKSCAASPAVTPLATQTASAGSLSNFMNRPGSIRAVSNGMLNSAVDNAKSAKTGQRIVFQSIPQLSTKPDSDDSMCERYEKETSAKPLEFKNKHFATVGDLTDWIMDFTQGKGDDGKSLYAQCPGNCSPQYTWYIDLVEDGLNVQARAVCGLPRNRDTDEYKLSIGLAAACPATESK